MKRLYWDELYNWPEIQKYYDDNHTWKDIRNNFKCSDATIYKATKFKKLILRDRSTALKKAYEHKRHKRSHSIQTKEKLSKIRLKYLTENPDKVPYIINHSSKKSYPELVFENALKTSDIKGWIYKYRNGIYEYDFAFPELKIDIEIDGGTHNSEKVKKIDERRDKFSKENGWTVVRFPAKLVKENVIECIEKIKGLIIQR